MKLNNLPNYKGLNKEERARLKKVFEPRIQSNYNIDGKFSVSKKELSKANG